MRGKDRKNRADRSIIGVRGKVLSVAVLAATCNGAAWAQSAAAPVEASDTAAVPAAAQAKTGPSAATQPGAVNTVQQDTVVVTGTRTDTKASQSLTPVDVISGAQLRTTGQSNLRDALVQLSPSISRENYAGDAAVLTDALTLHGLSPDHVLVLVNGKRRHTTANIALDGGLNQGSTGVDIDMIPVGLIDHIEVLRDGAAAQYGSDAIAGVINIILKRSSHGGELQTTNGQTYAGDGFKNGESANIGLDLGGKGFLDLSAEYNRQNHTIRTGPDDYFGSFQPGTATTTRSRATRRARASQWATTPATTSATMSNCMASARMRIATRRLTRTIVRLQCCRKFIRTASCRWRRSTRTTSR